MKVATVVGTRPEIIKLSRVMAALDAAEGIEHVLIHTGQNYDYELNEIFFDEMGIRKPDFFLDAARTSASQSVASMMYTLEPQLSGLKPDAILILGDTNSCFAAAYVAARLHIPVFHLEAGNRCFDFNTPEELNRVIIDHIPGTQLCYSERSRENLVNEGIPTNRIIKVGSPMFEVLDHYENAIYDSTVLTRLNLTHGEYFVVSVHREENVQQHFADFVELLKELAKYHQRVIVTTHPRTRKRLDAEYMTDLYDVTGYRCTLPEEIEFHKPFGLFDYCKLQQNSRCTLSDSGTISEESSILGFPALMLRTSHERPECDEEGGVIMTGFDASRVMESLEAAQKPIYTPDAYAVNNVSDKVVRAILSHTRRK